ncbi:MAG: hypothetical protein KAU36_01950 [candidate division Zixibacteria bacterium]|nr:hypothetical protein [candidate division Zixibacteria bacterium]
MKRLAGYIAILVAFVILAGAPQAAPLKGQAVTYSDFSRIAYIASSMSHVYFATTDGVIRYDKMGFRWEDPLTGAAGIDNRDIHRVWVDHFDQKLYAATSNDLLEYDLLFDRWYPINEIPALNNQSIHITTPDIMYAPPQFNFSSSGYLMDPQGRNFYFNDILDDRTGNLWIGTWGYGAALAGSSSMIIELLPYGLMQNRVGTIYNLDGILWVSGKTVGSYRTGITIFDPDENSFSYVESGIGFEFPSEDIYSINSSAREILVGTSGGLVFLDRERLTVNRTLTARGGLGDNVVYCAQAVGDSVYIGTANGVSLLSGASDTVRFVWPGQFFNTDIYDFEATDSTLWIASAAGAFQLRLDNGALQKFQDPHSIVFSRAYSIARWEDQLWIASDFGAVRIDLTTGETTPFSLIMSGYGRRALAVNDRIAAISSDRGMRIYWLDENRPHDREFTTEDGLPSDLVLSLSVDGDFIWVGTDRGLTRFLWNNPDRVD